MTSAVDRVDVRRRLAAVPDRLAMAARSADGRPVPAGEWSPAEIVRHLIAVESVVWHSRLRQLVETDKTTWPWVEPEPWPGRPGATLDELLALFASLRGETVGILDRLDDEGWARTGLHATWGEIGIVELMDRAVAHDNEHIASFVAQ